MLIAFITSTWKKVKGKTNLQLSNDIPIEHHESIHVIIAQLLINLSRLEFDANHILTHLVGPLQIFNNGLVTSFFKGHGYFNV